MLQKSKLDNRHPSGSRILYLFEPKPVTVKGGESMHSTTQLVWSSKWNWEKYLRPRDLSEALTFMEEYGGEEARIIAGGTDLLIQVRKREVNPKVLIDITQIPDLDKIKCEEGLIKIGALVTHHQAAVSPLLREKAGAISQGASWCGISSDPELGYGRRKHRFRPNRCRCHDPPSCPQCQGKGFEQEGRADHSIDRIL